MILNVLIKKYLVGQISFRASDNDVSRVLEKLIEEKSRQNARLTPLSHGNCAHIQ